MCSATPPSGHRWLAPRAIAAAVALLCVAVAPEPQGIAPTGMQSGLPHAGQMQRVLPERPDLVLVLWDDVSRRRVDLMRAAGLLPQTDRLASMGTEFRRGYAYPMCEPTRAVLLTMRRQARSAGFACTGAPAGVCLGANEETIPQGTPSFGETLIGAGYLTGYFGRWGAGTWWGDPGGGQECANALLQRGWSKTGAVILDGSDACGGSGYSDWLRMDDGVLSWSTQYNTTALADEAIAWLHSTPPGGRVLVFATQAGHLPLHWPDPSSMPAGWTHPPLGLDDQKYQAMVRSADFALGRLLDELDMSRTLVVLMADNGDPQQVPPPGFAPSSVKFSTREGGVGVPCIVAGLGFPRGRISMQPVSIVDIPATFADLAGIADLDSDGQSIVPALDGHLLARPWVYTGRGDGDDAVIHRNGWKERKRPGGQELFYNLAVDPLEASPMNESTAPPAVVATLRAALAEALR